MVSQRPGQEEGTRSQDKAGHTGSGSMGSCTLLGSCTLHTDTGSSEPGRSRNSGADTDVLPAASSRHCVRRVQIQPPSSEEHPLPTPGP